MNYSEGNFTDVLATLALTMPGTEAYQAEEERKVEALKPKVVFDSGMAQAHYENTNRWARRQARKIKRQMSSEGIELGIN